MTAALLARVRAQLERRPKGYLAVALDVEDIEALLAIADPPGDLPDEIVVHRVDEGDR